MVLVNNLSILGPAILLVLSAVQGKPLIARRSEEAATGSISLSASASSIAAATGTAGTGTSASPTGTPVPGTGGDSGVVGQYPLCGGRYPGCVDNKPVKQKVPGGKRKLAYFPYYEGPSASETFDEQYLDGLTHLILFGVDARKLDPKGELDYTIAYERDFPKDIVKKARAKGAAVMAAIGGWDLDTMFKEMTSETDARKMGTHIAKFAIANSLDGIDIDHEYPTAQQAVFWPTLLQQIKKEAPDLILSVAVPGEHHWKMNGTDTKLGSGDAKKNAKREYVYKEPVYQDPFEGWTSLIKKVEPMVDFINVMSYDLVNGFHHAKGAYHHASHAGTVRTVEKYVNELKVDAKKLNTGFAFYARYFPMSQCDDKNQLNCKLDSTFPEQGASSMRFDDVKNTVPNKCDINPQADEWHEKECGDAQQTEQKIAALGRFKVAKASFEKNVLPLQGTDKASSYDEKAMADSLYDKESKLFWTWQSPYAITQTCEAMKKDTALPIGGQFVFAIGQDSTDLAHMKAFQGCVKDW